MGVEYLRNKEFIYDLIKVVRAHHPDLGERDVVWVCMWMVRGMATAFITEYDEETGI